MLDKPSRAALLDEIAAITGAVCAHRGFRSSRLSHRNAQHVPWTRARRGAPRHDGRGRQTARARLAQPHTGGAARRQHRSRRRASAGCLGRRHHLVAHAARPGAGSRCLVEHHDGRGRPHAPQGPGSGRGGQSPFSAVARLRRTARSAAICRPMQGASRCSPTATPAISCSASRSRSADGRVMNGPPKASQGQHRL